MRYDITTVGTASMDTFLELADVTYKKDDTKNVNYYCFPVGGKVSITNLKEFFGGNATNTAIGLARLGIKTAILTSLDRGLRCQHLVAHLAKEGVATQFSKINDKGAINLAYILDWQKNKNDRVILSHHRPKDFTKLKWPKTDWIYLTALGEHYQTVTKQLPDGIKIAINPGGWEIGQGTQFLLPVLKRTQVLILNQSEAAKLANVDLADSNGHAVISRYNFLFKNLLKLGAEVVVITCGIHGAYSKSRICDETFFAPALKVEAQEVTGSGDAFASGFLAAYVRGKKLIDCLRWGILDSTACIQKIGAQNGLLHLPTLRKKYREEYKK